MDIVETFYEKESLKANQTEFRTDKVIEIKADKPYVKWKGYDKGYNNWFNNWIYKKKYCQIKWVIFHNLLIVKTK